MDILRIQYSIIHTVHGVRPIHIAEHFSMKNKKILCGNTYPALSILSVPVVTECRDLSFGKREMLKERKINRFIRMEFIQRLWEMELYQ